MSDPQTHDVAPAASQGPGATHRRPLVAFVLSLICPGLGQIYATRVARGTRLLGGALGFTALALAFMLLPPVSWGLFLALTGLVVVTLAYHVGVAIDAYRVTRRTRVATLTRANRVWVYIAILLPWLGLQQMLPSLLCWKSYNIPAASMLPGMAVGDHFMAWRGYFADHPPQLGDLVVFKLPRDNRTDFVKRIVGLPGNRVQMVNGRLHINDTEVPRERIGETDIAAMRSRATEYAETLPNGAAYHIFEMRDDGPLDNTPVYTVPTGHVFVLGDNRDNSLDSRVLAEVGFVPFGNLRDRPTLIYWSSDLGRIGQVLR